MAPVRRQVDVFRPMYQIIRRINLGVDIREALEAVTHGVTEAVGFQVAAISWLNDDLTFEVVSVAGSDQAREQLVGTRVPIGEIEVELLASDVWGSLLFLPEGRLEGELDGWIPETVPVPSDPESWRPEDTLRCPLRSPDGELLGLLSVDLPIDGRRPGTARRELLEMYADLAGLALSNASRATALEERVRLASAVQAALVSSDGDHDLAELVQSSATPIAEALGAATLWLRIFDPRDPGLPGLVGRAFDQDLPEASPDVLAHTARDAHAVWQAGVVAFASLQDDVWLAQVSTWLEAEEQVAVADGRAGWVRRRSIMPQAVGDDERSIVSFLEPTGLRRLLMVPVGAGSDCLGYLLAGRVEERDWTAEEIEAAGRIARHLAQAVITARLLERERVLVRQLEALDRYKNDLISTVSHELRTPLTSVIGHLELIEDAAASGHGLSRTSVDVVHRNLRRVLTLTDELLLLKRVSSDDDVEGATRTVVDLHRIAIDAITSVRPHADAQRVSVHLAQHGGPVLINGDAAELERVVLNLLDNAIKYTPPTGTVMVSTEHTDRVVRLVVRDSGMGISPEDQEELFTEFFRSTNPEALAKPGTGLGLSIVRRIVHRHGGSIRLTSEPGQGSTFTVRLPLSHAGAT